MIQYKDFEKSILSFNSIEKLLPKVNQWVDENNVKVVNIETIYSFGGTGFRSETGIRVWYIKQN